ADGVSGGGAARRGGRPGVGAIRVRGRSQPREARARMGRPSHGRGARAANPRRRAEAGARRLLPRVRRRRRAARRALAALDAARRAEVVQDATLAERSPRDADSAAVPDEEMREPAPLPPRHDLHQIALDLHGILLAREAEALREPADVRVDDDSLWLAQLGGDDVRSL